MAIEFDQWHRFANAPQSLRDTFLSTPYPADAAVIEKYAHINPKGRFCEVDMEMADRLLRIRTAAEVAAPENKAFVTEALEAIKNKDDGNSMHRTYNLMLHGARERNRMDRDMQMKQSAGDFQRSLYARERSISENAYFINCETMLEGLETVVGLREGPLAEAVKTQYVNNFAKPITDELVENAKTRGVAPPSFGINFANFDNVAQGINKAKPENWRKETDSVSRELSPEESDRVMSRYANSIVDTALSPIYDGMDQRMTGPANNVPNRTSLITVDGKTVREMIGERFEANPKNKGLGLDSDQYTDFYQKNYKELTNEFVSAGLMAGKRVEMFTPDPKTGTISKEPTQLTKKGYEPEPITKVTMNAWERFFSRRGFYKEKTAQLAEYNRVMDSRQRVTNGFVKDIRNEQSGYTDHVKDVYFKEALVGTGATSINDDMFKGHDYGSVTRSACVSACQGRLLAAGHAFEDVYDNTKLTAEKAEIGKEYVEHLLKKDKDWLAESYVAGNKRIHQEVENRLAGRRFDSLDAVGKDATLLTSMVRTAFDTDQELAKLKPEVSKIADKYYGQGSQEASFAAYDKVENQLSVMGLVVDAFGVGADAKSAAYSNGNAAMAQGTIIENLLREQFAQKIISDSPDKQVWDLSKDELGYAPATAMTAASAIGRDMEGMSELGKARMIKAIDHPKFYEKSGYEIKKVPQWKDGPAFTDLVRGDETKIKDFVSGADKKSEKTQRAVDKMEKTVEKDQAKQDGKDKKQEGPARKR